MSFCASFWSLTWWQGLFQFVGLLNVVDDQRVQVFAASNFELEVVLVFLYFNSWKNKSIHDWVSSNFDWSGQGWLVGWWPNQIRRVEFKIQYQHFLFNEEVSDCGSSLLALATQLVPTRPPRTKIHLHLASFRLTMTRKSLISLICLGYFIIQKYL